MVPGNDEEAKSCIGCHNNKHAEKEEELLIKESLKDQRFFSDIQKVIMVLMLLKVNLARNPMKRSSKDTMRRVEERRTWRVGWTIKMKRMREMLARRMGCIMRWFTMKIKTSPMSGSGKRPEWARRKAAMLWRMIVMLILKILVTKIWTIMTLRIPCQTESQIYGGEEKSKKREHSSLHPSLLLKSWDENCSNLDWRVSYGGVSWCLARNGRGVTVSNPSHRHLPAYPTLAIFLQMGVSWCHQIDIL